MNLKTCLKSVVATIFDLKLPVLGLLMLLFFITACNEHEVLPPKDALEESFEAQNLSDDEAEFFSDNNINEISHLKSIGKKLTDKKKDPFFMRSIKKTKYFMRQMNLQTEQKSIPHIAEHIGQPIWLGSYVAELEGGDMMNFVPIVPTDEALINGVLIYRNTNDDETSYSLTTREQMAAVETETDDQNYHLLVQMFYEFDKQLFGAGTEAYTEWAGKTIIALDDCSTFPDYVCVGRMTESPNQVITLFEESVFNTTPLSDLSTDFPCYFICDVGCTSDIYASGIADTEEETTWVEGNCSYADVIDDFLEDNNEPEIGQILLDIAILGYLTSAEARTLANAIDAYLNDPDNANTDAACVVQEVLNGLGTISSSAVDLMNQTYVADVYNLPASFPVADIESELLTDLVHFYCSPNSLVNACLEQPVSFIDIRDALLNTTNPSSPNTTMQGFYGELDRLDLIAVRLSVRTLCPRYACVL